MKINRLKITNFRSHGSSEYQLARLNVFRGSNGSGKSSIQFAIEELFTGKCMVTDEAGRGADDLIRDSAKEWEVTAECADVKLECRHNRAGLTQIVRSEKGQAKEFQHLGKQAIAWITENIAPIDALSAVLNAHRFIGMTEKDQKALLAGALASDPVEIGKESRWIRFPTSTMFASLSLRSRTASRPSAPAAYVRKQMPGKHGSIEDRLWPKVNKNGPVVQPELGPCWEWTAMKSHDGYGLLGRGGRDAGQIYVFRWLYEQKYGPLPPGFEPDHLCRNRACVNPDHMEAVTHRDNLLRGETLIAEQVKRTHCPRGHPYDEVNTFIRDGSRRCRECSREQGRERYAKKQSL